MEIRNLISRIDDPELQKSLIRALERKGVSVERSVQALYIPHLKDELKLTEDWTFALHSESRNDKLHEALGHKKVLIEGYHGIPHWTREDYPPTEVTLPKGTILTVDRIYIRQGSEDFDSVTFRTSLPGQKKKRVRFWAKLDDVNTIVYEKI